MLEECHISNWFIQMVSLCCVWTNWTYAMLNYLICQRYIHTDYIYKILPQNIFTLLCIPHATCSDKCYIWRRSLQGVFSYALLVCLHWKPNIHTCCIFVTSLHSVQSHDSSQHLLERRHNHTRCICETSLHDVASSCLLWIWNWDLN